MNKHNPYLSKVKAFIQEHHLINKHEPVIVALSGGCDSVVLLHVLATLEIPLVAAHCNFLLREDESLRDELFVKQLCQQKSIPIHIRTFDTRLYAQKKGISIEMAARELRYEWFNELSKELQIDKIAVAHHANDSVETILLNLIRGTGLRGLVGISPFLNRIIRPLLCLTQEEVAEFASQENLSFVVDSSNLSDVYRRNKIRHQIIPLLQEINPSFVSTTVQTAKHLKSVYRVYTQWLDKAVKRVVTKDKISIKALLQEEEPQTLLFEILHPCGFDTYQVQNIFACLKGTSGKLFFSATHRLSKEREYLALSPTLQQDIPQYYCINSVEEIEKLPFITQVVVGKCHQEFIPSKDVHTLTADLSKIKFPLTIRKWRQGDYFIPFGMNGRKKISDLFSDLKFSLSDKENCKILESDGKIVWVVGIRSDNRFRITKDSRTFLQITVNL